MTKRQSLEICRDMWQWLARNPTLDKDNYVQLHPELDSMASLCSCCEYTIQLNRVLNCDLCPLRGFWIEHLTEPFRLQYADYQDYCMGSIYYEWCQALGNDAERTRLAQSISDAAQLELQRLDE